MTWTAGNERCNERALERRVEGRRKGGREEVGGGREGEREDLTGSACKRTRSAGATSAGALLVSVATAGSMYVFHQDEV